MLQDPADLADAFFALHEQKPSVWSYAPWMHQGSRAGVLQLYSPAHPAMLLLLPPGPRNDA